MLVVWGEATLEGDPKGDLAMTRTIWKQAIAATAIGAYVAGGALLSGAAWAQTAAPAAPAAATDAANSAADSAKPKPKPKAGKPVINVVVKNGRKVGLVELDAAISGSGKSTKIAGPLAAGKKTVAHLQHDKTCQFDLHGTYDDGTTTDNDGVELCKDKTINLVD